MHRCPGYSTSSSIVTTRPDGARPARHKLGATAGFFINDEQIDPLLDTRILHIGGVGLMNRMDEAGRRQEVLAEARRRGVVTTLDVFASAPADLPKGSRLLPYVDYFTPSEDEARALSGILDNRELAGFLLELGAACVVLTLGAKGAYYRHKDGQEFHQPAFAINVKCTCGCGDCFNGGFATALALGTKPEEAVRLAQACFAQNATGLGSQAGVRDLANAKQFMLAASQSK
jgi:sugar/nucleoside kinase (ribokinase family)